ncbi:MAG: PAS domain S-box protein [Chloroflexi bacterium]|nr:PAS domain S-box protein [Chloroflexota bacterium]
METNQPIRILFVEDVPADAELAARVIRKEGLAFTSTCVGTQDEFIAALDEFRPDVIVSDYTMPQFDGMRALKISLERDPALPFIVLTGTLNEETAVKCIKAGATDYVIKDRITRLPFAVKDALAQRKTLQAKEAAEQALRASEQRFRSILDNIEDGCYEVNTAGNFTFLNPALVRMLGRPANELMGMNNRLYMTPEGGKAVFQTFNRVFRTGIPEQALDWNLVRPDGTLRSVEVSVSLIKAADGSINGFRGTVHDITERKREEEALAQERNLLRTLIDNLPDRIYAKDAEARFTLNNTAHLRSFGAQTQEEAVGKTDLDIRPRYVAARYAADDQAVIQSGEPLLNREEPTVLPTGEMGWLLTTKVPLRDPQGKVVGLVGISHDITKRVQAQETLRQSAARLETMHAIDQATLAMQPIARIAETALRSFRRLVPCWQASVMLFDAEAGEVTVVAVHAEGETKLSAGARFPAEAFRIAELQQGRPHIVEDIRNLPQLPPALQALQAEGMRSFVNIPLFAEDRPIGVLNLGADRVGAFSAEQLTIAREVADQLAIAIQQARLREQVQRRTAELEQRVAERTVELSETAARLQTANEKLKELDQLKSQFVANVSHELRTPLTNIKVYLHLLERGKPEKHAQYMTTLHSETNHLEHLIEDLLDISRLDQGKIRIRLAAVDVNRVMAMLVDARALLVKQAGLTLEVLPQPELPPALADADRLMQVLINLIANAVNYTPTGGSLVLSSGLQRSDGQTWVTLTVRDTGLGITPEDQAHIFERFYRGEAARQSATPGTGLGLAICQEIMQRHGGQITVESQVGQGSTFTVWLPAATHE